MRKYFLLFLEFVVVLYVALCLVESVASWHIL